MLKPLQNEGNPIQDFNELATPSDLELNPDFILSTKVVPAFTKAQAMEIGRRDRWRCQSTGCKKRFQDGFLVDMAHIIDGEIDFHGDNSSIDNGKTLCLLHHLDQHLFELNADPNSDFKFQSVRLIAQRVYRSGLMTASFYQLNPTQIIEDRDKIVELIKSYGFNPSDFLA